MGKKWILIFFFSFLIKRIGKKVYLGKKNLRYLLSGIGGCGKEGITTIRRYIKHRQRELLVDNSNIEVNNPRVGNVYSDPFHRKPKKKLLRRDPRQVGDLSIADRPGDVWLVPDIVLEVSRALFPQEHLEFTFGIDRESLHTLRKQTHRETVIFQYIVRRLLRSGVPEKEKKEHECDR